MFLVFGSAPIVSRIGAETADGNRRLSIPRGFNEGQGHADSDVTETVEKRLGKP